MRLSRRERFIARLPRFITGSEAGVRAVNGLWAAARELKTLLFIGPRIVLYRLLPTGGAWRKELPVQKTLRYPVAGAPIGDLDAFVRWLAVPSGQSMSSGEDSVYLAPSAWRASALAPLAARYPAACGLKISRNVGGIETTYAVTSAGRRMQKKLSASHDKQLLAFNYLHLEGIAPRLYDALELQGVDGAMRVAYVVEHVDGPVPDAAAYEATIARLKSLADRKLIELISPGGWSGVDFEKPGCNGNLIRSKDGQAARYVDVHNFVLGRYEEHLHQVGRSVAPSSHFGHASVLAGGRTGGYLYQEIPGLKMPAKRSPVQRMKTYEALIARAGLAIEGKVVLDVGCNLGLMGAEYLRRGAGWLHGWDMPNVVDAARTVLLSIGCTRFSLAGVVLSEEIDLYGTLPRHVQERPAADLILGYLAIRGHVGWLPALRDLKWRHMIYEGHQDDGPLSEYIAQLQAMVPVRMLAEGVVSDANSSPRSVAVFERIDA